MTCPDWNIIGFQKYVAEGPMTKRCSACRLKMNNNAPVPPSQPAVRTPSATPRRSEHQQGHVSHASYQFIEFANSQRHRPLCKEVQGQMRRVTVSSDLPQAE